MKTCSLQISVLKTRQNLEEEIKNLYSLVNETKSDGEKTKNPKKTAYTITWDSTFQKR